MFILSLGSFLPVVSNSDINIPYVIQPVGLHLCPGLSNG